MDSRNMQICALMLMFVSFTYASGCAQHKLDIIAVMDGSGSINGADFVRQKDAVIQLAQDLNLGSNDNRFGALVFSKSVTDTVVLSTDFQSLRSTISAIAQPGGGTKTDLGIQAMKQMFQSNARKAKKVGIVITDGKSNSPAETVKAAREAKKAGIKMFAIGVGTGSNRTELNAIASTSTNVVYLDNFSQLKAKFKSLIKRFCQQRCTAELYLPLTKDLKDHSIHNLGIDNNGVQITKCGMASFKKDAAISIPHFSNMDFGKKLDISFVLHKTQKTSQYETLVTNAECEQTGSIFIILKKSAIRFSVGNRRGRLSTLTVPMKSTKASVRLSVHKGVMTCYVNKVSRKRSFRGRIGKVAGALQIGRGAGFANFSGYLRDFKLSLCKP